MSDDLTRFVSAYKIKGVFSAKRKFTAGFGSTLKKSEYLLLVYAQENEYGNVDLQYLNDNYVPTGGKDTVSKEELLNLYEPEPAVYSEKVYPAMRDLTKTIARGERHRSNKELYSAEFEFKKALRIDEENIRATFDLGLTYLDRQDKKKAELVFRRLVQLKEAFDKEHKHMFNEFGIKLRQNQMYKQALKYYARAFKLEKEDEHLFYNMARVFYEKGSSKASKRFLKKALSLNPDFPEACNFLKNLEREKPKKSKYNMQA